MIEDCDVVIVGGGIAGLVAAHRLREYEPVVLEASDRVGGRIWSKQRGDLALSVGAHMFPPPDSVIGQLVSELGLEVKPITGSMLNIHLRGRIVRDTRPELLPFRLPLPPAGRISFARAGLKVKRDADAYMRLLQRRPGDTDASIRLRALQHRGDETFLEFLGRLHPDAFRIFEALANRSLPIPTRSRSPRWRHSSDMSGTAGISAGTCAVARGCYRTRSAARSARSYESAVAWNRCAWTGRAYASRTRVPTEQARSARAPRLPRYPPAPSGPPRDAMPPNIRAALGHVTFGPMVVLSILTDETSSMPWDDLYSILTPDLRFNMFFNHANFMHGSGQKQGSVIMVYGGGRRARAFLDASEEAIRDAFLTDLDLIYPQVRRHVAETWVKVWEHAGPFAAPGRWRAQAALDRGIGDTIFLAGDWVSEFVSMETAALTAVDAAANVRRVLGATSVAA
jgi:oxygen-dependent protoporphyrinogen oxidase